VEFEDLFLLSLMHTAECLVRKGCQFFARSKFVVAFDGEKLLMPTVGTWGGPICLHWSSVYMQCVSARRVEADITYSGNQDGGSLDQCGSAYDIIMSCEQLCILVL
jgi:hypothetical protein